MIPFSAAGLSATHAAGSMAARPGGGKGFVYEKMNGFQGSTITCVTYDYEYAKKRLSI